MPQESTEKREKAKQLYVESGGIMLLKDIASQLEVPPSTVSLWKKTDQWDKSLKRKPKKKKRPGSIGNTRAAGPQPSNRNNKKALRHGLYEKIKYDTMTPEEIQLIDQVRNNDDQIQMIVNHIAELEVRERRMYARIAAVEEAASKSKDGLITDNTIFQINGKAKAGENDEETTSGKSSLSRMRKRATELIQDIEVALTIVQRQKLNAIMSLHKLTEDIITRTNEDKRLEMERRRVETLERRLALVDPAVESDTLKEARKILEEIPSAF